MSADDLNQLAEALRGVLASAVPAGMADAFADWPTGQAVPPVAPAALPVTDWLAEAAACAPAASQHLVQAFCDQRSQLDWRQTYSETDLGRAFLDRYGWTLLVGPDAPLHSDTLLSGVLLLGPDIEYPRHHHAAEEVYVVLSGRASWSLGDGAWQVKPGGSAIHNPPWQWHGMRTDQGEPTVLGFLWNAGAVEKSRFRI